MTTSRDLVCQRLRRLGYSQNVTHLVINQITKWVNQSGEEWTVKRLKQLKVHLINQLADKSSLFRPSWVALRGVMPKGVFRSFFKEALQQRDPKRCWRVISALMVYTAFKAPDGTVTKEQAQKFLSAVTQPGESSEVLKAICLRNNGQLARELDHMGYLLARTFIYSKFDHPVKWMGRDKASPDLLGLDPSLRREDRALASVAQKGLQEVLYDVIDAHSGLPSDLKGNTLPQDYYWYLRELYDQRVGKGVVGKVSILQEPGYKARVVANPHPLYQALTSRLGNALWASLAKLEEDCHTDQKLGRLDIQQFLSKHPSVRMTSVDLSSATDKFPLYIQGLILESAARHLASGRPFYPKELWTGSVSPSMQREVDRTLASFSSQAKALLKVLRGEYELDPALATIYGKKTIRWENGQPLGAYCSFPLFSLAHHALVRSQQPIFYRILGDDLVMDSESAERHVRLLDEMKVPWAPEKSLMRSHMCEFAGYLITSLGETPQIKVKQTSDENFIAQAKALGPKSVKLFRPRQQRILKMLDAVLPSVYPLGLGWNTKGIKHETRLALSDYLSSFAKEQEEVKVALDPKALYAAISNRSAYTKPRFFKFLEGILKEPRDRIDPSIGPWTNHEVRIGAVGHAGVGSDGSEFRAGPSTLQKEEKKANAVKKNLGDDFGLS